MAKLKNVLVTLEHTVDLEGEKYYRSDYADGTKRHYRINKRQACLVRLRVDTNCKLIARIDAAIAEQALG